MEPMFNILKKRRPSLNDCAVKPLDKEVHQHLLAAYLFWPVIVAFDRFVTDPIVAFAIVGMFAVLGFLFYNMLVAMVQMSEDPKKRLRISQWIFCLTVLVLALRVGWAAL